MTRLLHEIRKNPESEQAPELKDFVRQEILAWLWTNKMPFGLHYMSAMECGLRITVFVAALKILDNLTGRGVHDFEIHFHLHPDVRITQVESLQDPLREWFVLENQGVRVFLKLLEGTFQVIRGQQDPLLGWYSAAYGDIRETAVLHCRRCGRAKKTCFETIVCYADK